MRKIMNSKNLSGNFFQIISEFFLECDDDNRANVYCCINSRSSLKLGANCQYTKYKGSNIGYAKATFSLLKAQTMGAHLRTLRTKLHYLCVVHTSCRLATVLLGWDILAVAVC